MKTHRQELALQVYSQGTSTVAAEVGNLPTASEPPIANTNENMPYSQEVELVEVTCAADVHLNQALQTTQLAVSGQLKTALPPPYQAPSTADELDKSNVAQQPTIIHDYRNAVVTDLQLQNVFAPQVGHLTATDQLQVQNCKLRLTCLYYILELLAGQPKSWYCIYWYSRVSFCFLLLAAVSRKLGVKEQIVVNSFPEVFFHSRNYSIV